MPNTKSAKKRHRQSLQRRAKNRAVKSTLRTQIKKVLAAVTAQDTAASDAAFREAAKKLDRAASANVIHKNRAARIKSRLSTRVKAAKQK